MTYTSLFIRIFGGVCGGAIGAYVSGKIYEYIYKKQNLSITNKVNTKPPSIINPDDLSYNKFQNVKSFQDILQIELNEYIDNKDKYNYDYDNEHGNTVDIIEGNNSPDYDVADYCSFLSSVARENN